MIETRSSGSSRKRHEVLLYWLFVGGMVTALALAGAHPFKVIGCAAAAIAVARYGLTLVPFYLGLVLVLPEAGGPFPAILSLPDVLFWPLLARAMMSIGSRTLTSRALIAASALAAAAAVALFVGIFVRHAAPQPAVFTTYQQVAHMATLVLALAFREEGRSTERALDGISVGACVAALLALAQAVGGEAAIALQERIGSLIGYPVYGFAHVQQYLWWGVRKSFSGYYSPNGLGAALMFALLLTTGLLLRTPSKIRFAAAALLGSGLVLTFSRGALVAAMLTLLVLAVQVARPEGRSRWLTSGSLAAGALLLPAAYTLLISGGPTVAPVAETIGGSGGVEVAATLKRRSAAMKIEEAKNLAAMWRSGTGLFGAGYGVLYERESGFVYSDHGVEVSPAYAEILYRSGIVGAFALVIAAASLYSIWKRSSRLLGAHPIEPALFGAMAHSAIDHPFLTVPGLVAVVWASWALLERSED